MLSLLVLALMSGSDLSAAAASAHAAHKAGPSKQSYAQVRAAYNLALRTPHSAGDRTSLGYLLERDGEALSATKEYIRDYNLTPPETLVAQNYLEAIESGSAVVTVTLQAGQMALVTDTRSATVPVVNEYGPFVASGHQATEISLRLRAGAHTLQVGPLCKWSFAVQEGERLHHTCPPAETKRSDYELLLDIGNPAAGPSGSSADSEQSRNAWVAPSLLTLGGTALGASVAAYVQSRRVTNEAERDYASRCLIDSPRPSCFMEDSSPLFGQAGDWKTASAIAGAIGASAVAAGAVLYFWPSDEDKDVVAWVSPTGVGVSGTF